MMLTNDNFVENRRHQRYRCSGKLIITQFNKNCIRKAELVDFSQEGLGFVSQFDLKPGNHLFMRVESEFLKIHTPDCEFKVRSVSVAEVKWCLEKPKGDYPPYVIGVKYVFPGYR